MREIATEFLKCFYSEICPKTGQKRAMEPVRRRWKPLQTLTFLALERQIGSVSCERASPRPRSQTLENAHTAGICGVDRAVNGAGPFSCFLFVNCQSVPRRSTRPMKRPRHTTSFWAEHGAVGLKICHHIPAQHFLTQQQLAHHSCAGAPHFVTAQTDEFLLLLGQITVAFITEELVQFCGVDRFCMGLVLHSA